MTMYNYFYTSAGAYIIFMTSKLHDVKLRRNPRQNIV